MATETILIQVREDGSRVVSRNLEDIGKKAASSKSGVGMLKNALAGLAGVFAVTQLRRWLDAWTSATGIVNIFSKSADQTAAVMDRLYKIAQNTRQPIDSTTQSYHQMSIAAAALGASQQQLLDFTEAVNMSFAISKTPANTARGGIIQLGQAMNEGIVRAQEYNSMINSMPVVLQIVSKNIEGVDGSLAKLRRRMLDGKLTSKEFFEALLKGAPEMAEMFQKSGRTIGQAFIVMENSIIKYIGRLDEASGFSRAFFATAEAGADNIENLVKAFVLLGSPLVVSGLLKINAALIAMRDTLLVFVAMNPFTAIIAGIGLAVLALTLWRDEIVLVKENQVTLGDYMRASWDMIAQKAGEVADWFRSNVYPKIATVADAFLEWLPTFDEVVNGVKGHINTMIGLVVGLVKAIITAIKVLPDAFRDIFTRVFNWMGEKANTAMTFVIDSINAVSKVIGGEQIVWEPFKAMENTAPGAAASLGASVKDSFLEGLNADYIGMATDGVFDDLNRRARVGAAKRQQLGKTDEVDLTAHSGSGDPWSGGKTKKGKDKTASEAAKLANQLLELEKRFKPSIAASKEMENATAVLDKSFAAGTLIAGRYVEIMEAMKLHYADIINPIKAYNDAQQQEFDSLKLISDQQAVANEVYQFTMDMRKKGITVTQAEIDKTKELAQAIQFQKLVQGEMNTIYQATLGTGLTLAAQQEAINQSYSNGTLTLDQYIIRMNQLAVATSNFKIAQGNGSFEDMALASLGRLIDGYQGVAAGMTDSFGTFFQSFTDGFADSIGQAIVYGDDLGESMKRVAQEGISALISGLIKLGIQWAINAAVGQSIGAAALASSTAMSVAAGAATAAAWAPAAAAVSLATFGTNAVPAMAGMTAANTLSAALSKMTGFQQGGYTGGGANSQVAGLVHSNEYVFDAASTSRLGVDNLEALRSGKASTIAAGNGVGASGGPKVTITLINNSQNSEIKQERTENSDGSMDVKVTVDSLENALAARMKSGRGALHSATGNAFGLKAKPSGG